MSNHHKLGLFLSTLIATVLLTGCTAQDPEVSEGPPSPTSSENQQSTSSTGATSTATAEAISGSYTGNHTFELGTPPPEATHIKVELTCVSPGTLFLPGGAKIECADQTAETTTGVWSLPLPADQNFVEVRTSEAEVSYEAKMAYEAE